MKSTLLVLLSLFCLSSFANTVTKVRVPLREPALIDLVRESAERFINYESDVVTEVLEVVDPLITELTWKDKKLVGLTIQSTARFEVLTPEYLDLLSKQETICTTQLYKMPDGNYGLNMAGSFCDYDPMADDNDWYEYYEGYEK